MKLFVFFSGSDVSNRISIVEIDDNYMLTNSYIIENYISPHSRIASSLTQVNAFFCLFGGVENYVYFNDLWLMILVINYKILVKLLELVPLQEHIMQELLLETHCLFEEVKEILD